MGLSYRARQVHRVRVPDFEAWAARHPLRRTLQKWLGSGRSDVPAFRLVALSEGVEDALCFEFMAGLSDEQKERLARGAVSSSASSRAKSGASARAR